MKDRFFSTGARYITPVVVFLIVSSLVVLQLQRVLPPPTSSSASDTKESFLEPRSIPKQLPSTSYVSSYQCTNSVVWWNVSCMFENVCVNSVSLQWYYFLDERNQNDQPPPVLPISTTFEIRDLDGNVTFTRVNTSTFDWDSSHIRHVKKDSLLVVPIFFNIGHALLDTMVPVYRALAQWNKTHLFTNDELNLEQWWRPWYYYLWGDVQLEIWNLVHATVPKFFVQMEPKYKYFTPGKGSYNMLTCYDNVILGTGSFGVLGLGHDNPKAPGNFSHFRDVAVRNLGLDVPPPTHPVVLFISREHSRRAIVNEMDVINNLTEKYKGSNVEVRKVRLEDLSIKEQVKAVQEATIYVSATGTSSHFSMFLKNGTTLLAGTSPQQGPIDNFWCRTQKQIKCKWFSLFFAYPNQTNSQTSPTRFNVTSVLSLIDATLNSGINKDLLKFYKKEEVVNS